MENLYVAYYRVSTRQQANSGLGLESQYQIVRNYAQSKGKIIQEYVEQESGKNDNRPMLKKAIVTSQMYRATLVIAKLDRLSRNLSFISNLMDSKVKFVCCDIPEANELTIHIFASLAQWERKRISERTKEALLAKKKREPDWKAGTNNLTEEGRQKAYRKNYMLARTSMAVRHAWHYIQPLLVEGHTYQYIASKLNEEGYRTRTGKLFHSGQVWHIAKRFGGLDFRKIDA